METTDAPYCQWKHLPAWILAGVVAGLAVGCASGAVQQAGQSLLVLQSMAVGAIAAVVLLGVAGMMQRTPPVWAGLVTGVVTVATQHVWLYRAAMEARRRAVNEQAAVELFKPGWSEENFLVYLWNVGSQPNGALGALGEWPNSLLWGIDGLVVTLSSMLVVLWVGRVRRQASGQRVDGP